MEGDALSRSVVASLVLLDVLVLLSLSGALAQTPGSMAISLACIFAHAFASKLGAHRAIDRGHPRPFQLGFWIGFPILLVVLTPGGWLGLLQGSEQSVGYAGLAALGMVIVLGLIALGCVALGVVTGAWAVLIDSAWQRVESGDDNAHLRLGAVLFACWFLTAFAMLAMSKWPGTLQAWPPDTPWSGAVLVVTWYVALAASGVSLLWSLVATVTRRG